MVSLGHGELTHWSLNKMTDILHLKLWNAFFMMMFCVLITIALNFFLMASYPAITKTSTGVQVNRAQLIDMD